MPLQEYLTSDYNTILITTDFQIIFAIRDEDGNFTQPIGATYNQGTDGLDLGADCSPYQDDDEDGNINPDFIMLECGLMPTANSGQPSSGPNQNAYPNPRGLLGIINLPSVVNVNNPQVITYSSSVLQQSQ